MARFKSDRELENYFGCSPNSLEWENHLGKFYKQLTKGNKRRIAFVESLKKRSFGSPEQLKNADDFVMILGRLANNQWESESIPTLQREYFDLGKEIQELHGNIESEMSYSLSTLDESYFLDLADKIKCFKKIRQRLEQPEMGLLYGLSSLAEPRTLVDCFHRAYVLLCNEWYDISSEKWWSSEGRTRMLITGEALENRAIRISYEFELKGKDEAYGDEQIKNAYEESGLGYLKKFKSKMV